MGLGQYIRPVRVRAVAANLGRVMLILSATMVLPALVALVVGDLMQSVRFTLIAGVGGGIGFLGQRSSREGISRQEALVVVALSYLVYGVMGAAAFVPYANPLDGFFESMSGITTTGLTVLRPESLPTSLLFFRSFSQWVGGAGIVILSLLILTGPSRSAFHLYASEFGDEKIVGSVRGTATFVLTMYTLLTALGFVAYVAAGFEGFDALLHVLATVSTGGFASRAESIHGAGGAGLHVVVMIFMTLGAIGFPAYYLLKRRRYREFLRDVQLRYLAVLALFGWMLMWGGWGWRVDRLIPSLFTSLTSITTTGFSIIPHGEWPRAAVLMSIMLMAIGGSSGSTAGGLKIYRFIAMLQAIRWHLLRALLPEESTIAIKIQDQALPDDALRQTFSIMGLYLILASLSALCFVSSGFAVVDAIFESVSAIGTVGLSAGLTGPSLAPLLKGVLIVDMWLGRLEILPILALLTPRIWFSGRHG